MGHQFLDEKQIRKILDLARENKRDFALLHLGLATGLRSSDLLKIRYCEVVKDGEITKMLRIKMKKTGRYIERPLRQDCRHALQEWMGSREDTNPYLFCSLNPAWAERGRPLSRFHHHKIVKKYLLALFHDETELQQSSTHTLRRSIAKLMHTKTGQIAVVQAFLGHTNPANTSLYIDQNNLRQQADDVVLNGIQY